MTAMADSGKKTGWNRCGGKITADNIFPMAVSKVKRNSGLILLCHKIHLQQGDTW